MDDTIKIRGGRGETPELQDRELGYNRDEKALYIGTPAGNVLVNATGVFYAIVGVTTGEEINAAYQAGKVVACKLWNGRVLYLVTDWETGNYFTFSSIDYSTGYASVVSVGVEGATWEEPTVHALATKEYIDMLMAQVNKRFEALETPEEPEPH